MCARDWIMPVPAWLGPTTRWLNGRVDRRWACHVANRDLQCELHTPGRGTRVSPTSGDVENVTGNGERLTVLVPFVLLLWQNRRQIMNFEFERQIMRSSLVYRMGCVSAALAVISVSGANTAEVLGAPEVPHAYCYPNGDCCAPPPGAACTLPGVDQGPFTTCLGDLACRMPDDTCVDADAMCCDDIGGTPVGPGTACLGDVACCKPNGSGDDVEELFCEDLGGISRGSGTTCADTDATCGIQACCISDPGPFFDFCDDVNYYNC